MKTHNLKHFPYLFDTQEKIDRELEKQVLLEKEEKEIEANYYRDLLKRLTK
jgi:hypothetical protein